MLRVLSEQYREPDSAVLFEAPAPIGAVTSPILVSALMVVLGTAVVALRPRSGPLIGGVRPRPA
jgi:hypothetical protein